MHYSFLEGIFHRRHRNVNLKNPIINNVRKKLEIKRKKKFKNSALYLNRLLTLRFYELVVKHFDDTL